MRNYSFDVFFIIIENVEGIEGLECSYCSNFITASFAQNETTGQLSLNNLVKAGIAAGSPISPNLDITAIRFSMHVGQTKQ
ncbi:hypothetical protein C7H79_15930 [Nitrosomonas supralitoralis]|uniref:Uncharacterized protein n=1 Tax=Nitrosomonas supralitoralis TaxID=2116706 RepID=A0A2P7NRB6_9PROT|nr:hypothetical protein C7H79_15930 [Nitrosomonas supralitoralis]